MDEHLFSGSMLITVLCGRLNKCINIRLRFKHHSVFNVFYIFNLTNWSGVEFSMIFVNSV